MNRERLQADAETHRSSTTLVIWSSLTRFTKVHQCRPASLLIATIIPSLIPLRGYPAPRSSTHASRSQLCKDDGLGQESHTDSQRSIRWDNSSKPLSARRPRNTVPDSNTWPPPKRRRELRMYHHPRYRRPRGSGACPHHGWGRSCERTRTSSVTHSRSCMQVARGT